MQSNADLRRAARRNPDRVTRIERSIARTSERRFETAVANLDDEVVAADRAAALVRKAIRTVGGRVIESTPIPNSVIARVPGGELDELLNGQDVQAIVPAPRERPALDVATPLVGSPSWWSAGHLGGEGANDMVPSDAGLLGEGVDPNHPAYAGLVPLDQSPNVSINDHGTHSGGIIISNNLPNAGTAGGVDKLVSGGGRALPLGPPGWKSGGRDLILPRVWNVSSSGDAGRG